MPWIAVSVMLTKGDLRDAPNGGPRDRPLRLLTLRRSGRVAEGGALLRRYVGEYLHRGFESLLLRSGPSGPHVEGWQSGRMRRSRKPLSVVRRIEGSNPSPSAFVEPNPATEAGFRPRRSVPSRATTPFRPQEPPQSGAPRSRRTKDYKPEDREVPWIQPVAPAASSDEGSPGKCAGEKPVRAQRRREDRRAVARAIRSRGQIGVNKRRSRQECCRLWHRHGRSPSPGWC